jgi:hypothetical protein
MKKEDVIFYQLLGEFALNNADAQSNIAKMFLKRFLTLESFITTQYKVYRMPEGYEKEQALAGLDAASESLSKLGVLKSELLDYLARGESYREKLEAFLVNLDRTT